MTQGGREKGRIMKKINPTKMKGMLVLFATLAFAISIGVSGAPQEVVRAKAVDSTVETGVFTFRSNATSELDYDADPGLGKFEITKTNSEQEMFVLGDKTNFVIGANPHVTDIMLGEVGTAGKVSFTMPAGVYVTVMTLYGVKAFDGKATVSANGNTSVYFIENDEPLDIVIFNTYMNKVVLQTNKRIWIESITIETATLEGAAEHFANAFLSITAAECAAGNVSSKTFTSVYSSSKKMDAEVKAQFSGVNANAEGNVLEQFIARYTHISIKYGYSDFMGLGLVQGSSINKTNKLLDNNEVVMTIVISVIGITALAGFYFLKKKKEDDRQTGVVL